MKEIHANAGIIRDVHEMRRCLRRVIENEMFTEKGPARSNKRFYPRLKTIRSHMVNALQKSRNSKIDQECLVDKISKWRRDLTDDSFFFRPKSKESTSYGKTKVLYHSLLILIKSWYYLNFLTKMYQ